MIILAAILIAAFQTVKANDEKSIPYQVKEAFENLYPSLTDVTWRSVSGGYVGSFDLNNEKLNVYFDADAELIGTSKVISADQLPCAAKSAIQSEFEGCEISLALVFTSAAQNTSYIVRLENDKRIFYVDVDADGNTNIKKSVKKVS